MASLTTYSMAAIVDIFGPISFITLAALANLTLGTSGTTKQMQSVTATGCALTATSVNAILALLVSLDGTNGTTLWQTAKTCNLSGGTSAAPTGQGITDKATLNARPGVTVTTN